MTGGCPAPLSRPSARVAVAALCASSLLAASPEARAEPIEFDFGGMVQYDLRFRPNVGNYGTYYQDIPEPLALSRNELIGKFRVGAKLGRFGMKSDLDFVLRAYPKTDSLSDLSLYQQNTPFRFEAHELYLYGRDLGTRGLDLRVGQMKPMFGVGDQFNPTNTISANDYEDVLLFGDQQGNLMVRMDYAPAWNWQITGILVPIFKPALLPRTAYLGQTPDRYPFHDEELRWNLAAEQAAGEQLFGYPTIVNDVAVRMPEFHPKNMSAFARVAAILGGQDIALSYYYGRSDLPQPVSNVTSQVDNPVCADPDDPDSECVDGTLSSDVVLAYPRMHVLGLNMAGEFDAFGWLHKSFKPLGYRFELGVFFPEETNLAITQDDIQFAFVTKDGPYPYPNDDNRVLRNTPFAKWVLGLDYTFNKHLYMNTQWVHGFPNEFGAGDWITEGWQVRASGIRDGVDNLGAECLDIATVSGRGRTCAEEWLKPRIGDYLVMGLDVKFAADRALLRLFTIWDLLGVWQSTYDEDAGERVMIHHSMFTENGFSAVIYPAFEYNLGNGLELHAGALLQFGKRWTMFGAPENGGHQIWTRARYSF